MKGRLSLKDWSKSAHQLTVEFVELMSGLLFAMALIGATVSASFPKLYSLSTTRLESRHSS